MDLYSAHVMDWLPRARKSRISAYASMVTLRTQLGTTNAGRVAEPRNYSPPEVGFPKQIISWEYDDRVVFCNFTPTANSRNRKRSRLWLKHTSKDIRWR